MRRDTRQAKVSGSLSNTHAGPRPTPYKTSHPVSYGGYPGPPKEWRTLWCAIRYCVASLFRPEKMDGQVVRPCWDRGLLWHGVVRLDVLTFKVRLIARGRRA